MRYLKILIGDILIYFCLLPSCLSQNLVPNPSFENYSQCPLGYNRIYDAFPWNAGRTDGISTDLFNTCSSDIVSFVPRNHGGYQWARTGKGYSGIIVVSMAQPGHMIREYMQSQLKAPLKAGKKYLISFYSNLSTISSVAIKDIGAYISKLPPRQEDYPELLPPDDWPNPLSNMQLQPQIVSSTFKNDTLRWMEIKGEYMAMGGEEYITIGHFKNDLISFEYIDGSRAEFAYYYIDDISIYQCDKLVELGNDTILCANGEPFVINAFTEGATYKWSDNSKNSTLSARKSGLFWVDVYLDGCHTRDSISVNFEEPNAIDLGKDTILCGSDNLILNPNNPELFYIWNDNSTESTYEVKSSGVYSVEIRGKACFHRDTIKVTYYDCPLDIPNVITPNEDSKNESFTVKEIKYDTWKISICNRWGKEVYSENEYKNDWKGENVTGGVYYYALQNNSNKKLYKGWVQVLK